MTIRSFVLRQGRMTPGQQRAFDQQWSHFGVDILPETPLALETVFTKPQPVILEIGFGMGDSLVSMAINHPELNFFGIEVHKPGVGHCLRLAAEAELSNLKVARADAVEVLKKHLADNSLYGVHLYFPDPWHKKKHNKRRIVQPAFLTLLAQKLTHPGYLHFVTDWGDYAEHMQETLSAHERFKPSDKSIARPETKFERRGLKLGHSISEFVYETC